MRRGAILFAMLAAGGALAPAARAQPPAADQQGYIAYHECMMLAAMRVSRTDAPDEEVFALVKRECAATRAAVASGQQRNTAFLAALDRVDAEEATDFPEWIHGVRARGEAGAR